VTPYETSAGTPVAGGGSGTLGAATQLTRIPISNARAPPSSHSFGCTSRIATLQVVWAGCRNSTRSRSPGREPAVRMTRSRPSRERAGATGPARSSGIAAVAAAPSTALLAHVGLFSDLSTRELKAIDDSMREHGYPAGREVVAGGKRGVAFFVIVFRRDRPDHGSRTDRERDCADRPRLLDTHLLGVPVDRHGEFDDLLEAAPAAGSPGRQFIKARRPDRVSGLPRRSNRAPCRSASTATAMCSRSRCGWTATGPYFTIEPHKIPSTG
jgi:hypothetical protein